MLVLSVLLFLTLNRICGLEILYVLDPPEYSLAGTSRGDRRRHRSILQCKTREGRGRKAKAKRVSFADNITVHAYKKEKEVEAYARRSSSRGITFYYVHYRIPLP